MKSNNLKVTNVQRLSMDYYTLLKRDYHYLVHAWNCRDFNCCSEGCAKMKNLILHSYECKKQECQLCKSTLILCYHHVWVCKHDLTCNLPTMGNYSIRTSKLGSGPSELRKMRYFAHASRPAPHWSSDCPQKKKFYF